MKVKLNIRKGLKESWSIMVSIIVLGVVIMFLNNFRLLLPTDNQMYWIILVGILFFLIPNLIEEI